MSRHTWRIFRVAVRDQLSVGYLKLTEDLPEKLPVRVHMSEPLGPCSVLPARRLFD